MSIVTIFSSQTKKVVRSKYVTAGSNHHLDNTRKEETGNSVRDVLRTKEVSLNELFSKLGSMTSICHNGGRQADVDWDYQFICRLENSNV